jgi:drug/metabolite transporter (DMT)-like permease
MWSSEHRVQTDVAPLGVIVASFAVAALPLAPAAAIDVPATVPSAEVLAAIAVLGLACTALAFVAFFALIAEAGPARASLITYVLPLVAIAFGLAILGEQLRPAMLAGLATILAGCWLATGGRPPRRHSRDPMRADGVAARPVR